MPTMSGISMGSSPDLSVHFSPSPFIMADEFDKCGVNVKSFKEPLTRSVRQVMRFSFQKNFTAQGRPVPWEPLAQATIDRKGSSEILIDTLALFTAAGQMNIWTITGSEAYVGKLPQRVWYGAVHQTGTLDGGFQDAFSEGIPARPWAVIQDEDAVEIEDIFLNWIDERINRDIALGRRAGY